MKQKLRTERRNNNSVKIVGDFNTPLTVMDRTTEQKKIEDLNSILKKTISEMDLQSS